MSDLDPEPLLAAWYVKRADPVEVEFATTNGQVETLEGLVSFQSGDAILTGVCNERWCVSRDIFLKTYEAIPPLVAGEDGQYRKKFLPVWAEPLSSAQQIPIGRRGEHLQAQPGDWLLTTESGKRWVVADNIFRLSYQLLDARVSEPPPIFDGFQNE